MAFKLNRREFLSGTSTLLLTTGLTPPVLSAPSDAIAVVDLRTESVDAPVGVETSKPQLSWRIEAGRRGMRQSAYRIEVASSAEALTAGHADLWDSGHVDSDNSIGIRYDGATLRSRQHCFWRVHIWDERSVASAPSATHWWEMGLLDPADWSAQWLAAEDQTMKDDRATGLGWIKGPLAPQGETTQFRLNFSLPEAAQVVLFVAAFGKIHIWMDGNAIAMPPTPSPLMGPPPVAGIPISLAAGRHVLAISFGAPDPPIEFLGFHDAEIAPFLRVTFADGRMIRFNGHGWKTSLSSAAHWQFVDFNARHWGDAVLVEEPRPQPWPKQTAILMRRTFLATKSVHRARIYATALGAYELHLNGSRVGDALLTPESTDFRKRALYRVYDVTKQIVSGENVLGAVVGDGWYASYTAAIGRYAWGPAPRRLLAQLELTYADGSREITGSGPEWQTCRAPIVSSEIFDGEYYDARLEQPGWSARGFATRHWSAAQIAPAPPLALTAQIGPPIRRKMILNARAVTEPRPGVFVFDFGQNFAGWCRLNVNGPAGTQVELRFAEILKSSGEVNQLNLRSARATDTYVLKGDPAGEAFEPHFTYHGFRYVQMTGFPGTPAAGNLQGVVIHSDLQLTGKLNIDNPLIQQFWHNTLWSQRSNFIGVPTDCPQRDERLGWLGDANVFWDAAAFNMNIDAFTRRFMADTRDAQAADGAFADFNPSAFRISISTAGKIGVLPDWADTRVAYKTGAAPGWADAGICMPWTVWQRYGDTGIIDENWRAMTRYLRFIHDSNPDFVWRNDRGTDYGDWLALDAKNPWDPTTPKELVATAIWAHSVACMAQMAEATARTEEARNYRALWTHIADAFQKNFIAADGMVGNDSQAGYIFALRYDLVPDALRSATAAELATNITRRGTLLSTGFLGTSISLDVLADAGRGDLVYSLLLRTDFPSWGYMVAKGATTIWESWNGDTVDMTVSSFNHYALGAVCGFIFRRIAGIAPLEPGFRKIEVRPVLDPRVKNGGGEYDSVLGRISTAWQQHEAGGFNLDLTVPPNATALVYVPATGTMTVTEGGRALSGNRDIRVVTRTSDQAIMEVGSGRYQFAVRSH
jgi:alpha-L-rhamnosidase